MDEKKKLYETLKRDGYYTKSYEDFNTQWNDKEYRDKVYNVTKRDKLYTKDRESFELKYFAPVDDVKKKVQTPVSTGTVPQDSQDISQGGGQGIVADIANQVATQQTGQVAPSVSDLQSNLTSENTNLGSALQGLGGDNVGVPTGDPSSVDETTIPTVTNPPNTVAPPLSDNDMSGIISDIDNVDNIGDGSLTVPNVPINENIPNDKLTYNQEVSESSIPLADAQNIKGKQQITTDNQIMMGLQEDKGVIEDIFKEVKDRYKDNPEGIANGDYIQEVKDEINKRSSYTNTDDIFSNGVESLKYLDDLLETPKREKQKELGNISIRKTLSSNPDMFDQSVLSPDEIDENYSKELIDTYGEDVTIGEALFLNQDDFDTRELMQDDYARFSGDILGMSFVDNAREIYLKDVAVKSQKSIIDEASSLFGKSLLQQTLNEGKNTNVDQVQTYYRGVMANKMKEHISPVFSDAYDVINELEDLLSKQSNGGNVDVNKIIKLQGELKQYQASGKSQIYDPSNGKYHIPKSPELGPEAGKWSDEVDEFKKNYADIGMSQMRKLLDEELLKYDELARINNKYAEKGGMAGFTPGEKSIVESEQRIQAMSDMLIMNYNPAKDIDSRPGFGGSVGRGIQEGLIGNSYKGEYEEHNENLALLQEAGMPINDEITKFMTPTDMEELGNSLGNSLAAGIKIGAEIAIGNKLKGVFGISKAIIKMSKGSKLKEKILTGAFDGNMYGLAYEAAGESYATGLGEHLGEKLGGRLAKTMKLNSGGLSALIVEYGTGNITEIGAEYAGELADRIAKGEDNALANTLGVNDKDGMAGKLKNLAIHTMILTGGSASFKVVGILYNKLKTLKSKPNKTQDDIEEIELMEENINVKKQSKAVKEVLNNDKEIAKYNEIKDKPDEDLSDEEKITKMNFEGVVSNAPVSEVKDTKYGEQIEMEFPDDTKTPEDKLQAERDRIAGIEGGSVDKAETTDTKEADKTIDVYHGGEFANTEGISSPLFVTENKAEAGRYSEGNEGEIMKTSLSVDEIMDEESARGTLSEIGVDVSEGMTHEYIDPRFPDYYIGEEKVNEFYDKVKEKGYGAVRFQDSGVDSRNSESIVVISPNESLSNNTSLFVGESKAIDLLSEGYVPIVNGKEVLGINEDGIGDLLENNEGNFLVEMRKLDTKETDGGEIDSTLEGETDNKVASTDSKEIKKVDADISTLEAESNKVKEGLSPIGNKEVFESLKEYSNDVSNETGLEGKELIKEVANRVESNSNIDINADDVVSSENELLEFINKNKIDEKVNEKGVKEVTKKVEQDQKRNEDKQSVSDNGGQKGHGSKSQLEAEKVISDKEATSKPSGKVEAVSTKSIKEKGKKIANVIRKAKVPKELGVIKSSMGADVAWNTVVETTAKAIETGANIAQAVSNGVTKLKETDWYKGLSEGGKKQAESVVSDKLTEEFDKAKETIAPPKPPKDSNEGNKSSNKRERRKTFLNRAKKDPTIDERTKRFLNDVDEMYEVETNEWANSDADRLMNYYLSEGRLEDLIEDVKSGEDMSASVQSMLAQKLVRKLESEGRFEEAADMDSWIDVEARKMGQFIQALRESSNPDSVKRAKESTWRKEKESKMSEKTSNKQNTNEEVVSSAKKATDSAVNNFNENIDDNVEINKAIKNVSEKSVKEKETKSKKAKRDKRKEEDYRKKRKADFKKNKNKYLNASLPGLSKEGIEYAGDIAASYVRQGFYNISEVIAKVQEHFKSELEYELTETDTKAIKEGVIANESIVKQGLKDMDTSIKDIVKNHFKNKDAYGKKLSDKLIDEAGLSAIEAKFLEDKIMESFDKAVRSEMETQLKGMFDRIKKNGTPKRVKTYTEKVIDAYRLGALNDSKFADQFGEYFGFVSLTNSDRLQIAKMAEALETAPEGSHIQKKMMGDFTKHLEKLEKGGFKYKAFEIAKMAMEMWYTSILAGFTTLYRGAKGILMSAGADMMVEGLKNPKLFFNPKGFVGGVQALAKGFKKGGVAAKEMMRTGYNAMDEFRKMETSPSETNKLINDKQKGIYKKALKAFYYAPAKMVRALVAADSLLKFASKELFTYTKVYNELLTEGMDRGSKKFWDNMHSRMANSKAEYDIALETAKGEKKAMEEAGVSTKGFNEKLRAYEIMEDQLDASVIEYSRYKAEKSGLNQTPQGTVGVLYETLTRLSNLFPPFKFVVPFLRIPSNSMNMWLDWSPLGFKRAAFGYGLGASKRSLDHILGEKKVKEMRIGVKSMTADERIELMVKATIGTAAWGVLFWQMGLDDDDENKYIKLSYNGHGDYKKNEGLRKEGWRPFAMSVKVNGEWSGYLDYRDSPLGFVMSSIGSMNDQLAYQNKDKITKNDHASLILSGLASSMFFIKEQNYMQGISKLMSATNSKKGFGPGMSKYGIDTPTGVLKSLLFPNTYKQLYGTYKSLSGKPQSIKTKFSENILKYTFQRMVSDIPFLEDMEGASEGEMFDVLGYPIVKKIHDQNPILSLVYAEDFDTKMRESNQYGAHEFLNKKGLSVAFYYPKSHNGVKLTSAESVSISKYVALGMRGYIDNNNEKLSNMYKHKGKDVVQDYLNKRKRKLGAIGKKKLLKKGLRLPKNN